MRSFCAALAWRLHTGARRRQVQLRDVLTPRAFVPHSHRTLCTARISTWPRVVRTARMRTWPRVGRPAVAQVGGHSVRRVHSRRARRSARLARWFSARTGRAHCTCPGDHGAGRIPRSDGRHAHLPRRPANVSDVGMPTFRARPRPTCACTTCPAITATRASRAHGRWRPPGRWRRGRSGPVVRWWSGGVFQGQIEDVGDAEVLFHVIVPGSTWRRYCDTSLYHRAVSCLCD